MSMRSEAVKLWRKATKERMVAAMGGKCQCCGYDHCTDSMDFHHIDPAQKELSFGKVTANPRAWPVLVNELRKCILVCRNCHGEIHAGVRTLPENYVRFDERYVDYRTHPNLCNPCPTCGEPKPQQHRYCSPRCSGRVSKNHKWDKSDLIGLAKVKTAEEIAEIKGVCHATVTRHLRKVGVVAVQPTSKKERTFVPFVHIKSSRATLSKVSDTDPNWRHRPVFKSRKVERPSKEELTEMVWESSLLAVGKRFGVGDNAVRKWCKSYGIKLPPQGYAQRRQAGYSHEEALVSQKKLTKVKRHITVEIAQQAAALRAQDVSYRDIGEQLGFGHWSIQSALRRYGLEVAAQAGNDPA